MNETAGCPAPAFYRKYNKIKESLGLALAATQVKPDSVWVVTEKIHGANFCMSVPVCLARPTSRGGSNASTSQSQGCGCCRDASAVQFSKRSGPLAPGDDFFSFRTGGLANKLEEAGRRLRDLVLENHPNGKGLGLQANPAGGKASVADRPEAPCRMYYVYGELFGGYYPSKDFVDANIQLAVQRGIWYSPNIEFMAFDVAVAQVSGGTACGAAEYLDFDVARRFCVACGLLFVQSLFEGSLPQCLDFPIRFQSTIPSMLKLPELPEEQENVAEGVVVRSKVEGPPAGAAGERRMVKRKIPEFSESRYQNNEWKRGQKGGGQVGSEKVMLSKWEALALVTPQRLDNVYSKHGKSVPAAEIIAAFRQDVLDDLEDEDRERCMRIATVMEEIEDEITALVFAER